jgi:hypothetical protein
MMNQSFTTLVLIKAVASKYNESVPLPLPSGITDTAPFPLYVAEALIKLAEQERIKLPFWDPENYAWRHGEVVYKAAPPPEKFTYYPDTGEQNVYRINDTVDT